DDRHRDAERVDALHLVGDRRHHRFIDAERLRAHQGLAGDLEEDAAVGRLLRLHQWPAWAMTSAAKSSLRFSMPSPSLKREKRRTWMFSPILPTFSAMSCATVLSGSLTNGCSRRTNSE